VNSVLTAIGPLLTLKNAGTVLTAVGALACFYFVAAYQWETRGSWRKTAGGKHVMGFTAVLGAFFGLVFAARVWPSYPGRDWISLVVFAAAVWQVLWRNVLLYVAQHPQRQSRRDSHEARATAAETADK